MIPALVSKWLQENHFGQFASRQSIGGGCINHGMLLKTTSGDSFFLKVNPNAPDDMFRREAEGLQALKVEGGPTIPKPYLYGPDFLLMEDLSPAPRKGDYWRSFGESLATLHNYVAGSFGFDTDNYIGSTPQPNSWIKDGFEFFAQERLVYMASLAFEQGLLNKETNNQIVDLASRLTDLIPEQPPSLIHGDLWSGNAITDSQGQPAIIDPAVHFGWAEAELAMTSLFGAFPSQFYRAYETVHPLEPGYQERFPIYNLYHLLNHLVLFGRGYLGQVKAVLKRYQ